MKPTINLSTRSYINRRALRTALLATICALVLWLVVGLYLTGRDIAYLRRLDEKIVTLRSQYQDSLGGGQQVPPASLERRWQEVAFINRLLEQDTYRWTALLDQLEEQSINGIVINSIQPDFKDHTLAVRGYARELQHLRRFLDNLIASGDYREVYLLDQKTEKLKDTTGRDRDAVAFDLSLVQGD